MYRKIRNTLAALAITGGCLFQANGCDVVTQTLIEEIGNICSETVELPDIDWGGTSYTDGYGYDCLY